MEDLSDPAADIIDIIIHDIETVERKRRTPGSPCVFLKFLNSLINFWDWGTVED
jgi:hypothetical protein